MNFDIGLEEMLQPITKETSSRQNGVEKWNNLVFMNIIVLDIYVLNDNNRKTGSEWLARL
jgi:hypothetical protein